MQFSVNVLLRTDQNRLPSAFVDLKVSFVLSKLLAISSIVYMRMWSFSLFGYCRSDPGQCFSMLLKVVQNDFPAPHITLIARKAPDAVVATKVRIFWCQNDLGG